MNLKVLFLIPLIQKQPLRGVLQNSSANYFQKVSSNTPMAESFFLIKLSAHKRNETPTLAYSSESWEMFLNRLFIKHLGKTSSEFQKENVPFSQLTYASENLSTLHDRSPSRNK